MDIKELNINAAKGSSKNHPWEYARAKIVCKILKNRSFINQECNPILDIGCGDIFFLNYFCSTIEHPYPVAVDIAFESEIICALKEKYQNFGCTFYQSVDEVGLGEKKANIVFLMDVIEHIEDDVAFLSALKQKKFVGTDTLFMITVPAFQSLYSSHDKWLGHYRRYSSKLLIERVTQAGMKVVDDGYFFFSLLIPRFLQKKIELLWKEKERPVTGIGGWNGGKTISWLYEKILLCDFLVTSILRKVGIKLPGLSTFVICKQQ